MAFFAVVDETGFEAGLDAGDDAFIDIAFARFVASRFDIDIDQLLAIDDGDAQLFRVGRIKQHPLHGYSAPVRRRHSPAGPAERAPTTRGRRKRAARRLRKPRTKGVRLKGRSTGSSTRGPCRRAHARAGVPQGTPHAAGSGRGGRSACLVRPCRRVVANSSRQVWLGVRRCSALPPSGSRDKVFLSCRSTACRPGRYNRTLGVPTAYDRESIAT